MADDLCKCLRRRAQAMTAIGLCGLIHTEWQFVELSISSTHRRTICCSRLDDRSALIKRLNSGVRRFVIQQCSYKEEMNEIKRQNQSKHGIYSCVIALSTWTIIVVIASLVGAYADSGPYSFGKDVALGAVVLFVVFPIVLFGGHLMGLIYGLIGVNQKTQKRTFAVIGLIMNALIPISLAVLYLLLITCAFCPDGWLNRFK